MNRCLSCGFHVTLWKANGHYWYTCDGCGLSSPIFPDLKTAEEYWKTEDKWADLLPRVIGGYHG